jgi:hypothetical protein
VLVAAVLAAIVTIALRRATAQAIGRATVAAAFGYILLSALRLGPAFAVPSYTIRETSRDLGTLLAGVPDVATSRAEGLFNENRIRYRSQRRSATDRPGAWVATLRPTRATTGILRSEYCVLKTYGLSVSKEWRRARGEERPEARVWILRSSGRCPAEQEVEEDTATPAAPSRQQ